MTSKSALRQLMQKQLAEMDGDAIAEKSARICAQIMASPEWQNAEKVCLFAAQPREPNLEPLWRHRETRVFYYPRVNGAELDLLRIEAPSELALSRWQLREPIHDSGRLIAPSALDLILVPGLAFMDDGARLGRGGGFYDRLLSRPGVNARTFGICFAEQLCETIPTEAHDRRMDGVISA